LNSPSANHIIVERPGSAGGGGERGGQAMARSAVADVGVVVVTHRAREHLRHCLPPLLRSPLRPRVLVVNSSSGDGTVEEARRLGAEVMVVPRREFNHGLTRERARAALGAPVVAMLTPDAYPTGDDFLERLVAPVREGVAAVSYGRQLARPGAGLIERFGREFNYPDWAHVRGIEDWPRHGSYTHFCSNACAAWSSAALDRIGGFRATLVSEETIAAAELLRRGERIAYAADAVVFHSHAHGLADEFGRHFDIGYARRRFAGLLRAPERDELRGRRFARALIDRARRERPAALPLVLAHLAAKWLGYKAGLAGPSLPLFVARQLSGQDYFWDSAVATAGAAGGQAAAEPAPALGRAG
jgi:rhamnosyltransferase